MEGLNRAILLGNLGADPELRMTGGGQAVLKLRLATSETYLDKDKQRQEKTEWHAVVIWGKRAEGLAKVLHKGDRLLIEGGIRTTTYDDRDGHKRYRTEIVATEILLQGSPGGKRASNEPARAPEPEQGAFGGEGGYGDDDLPF